MKKIIIALLIITSLLITISAKASESLGDHLVIDRETVDLLMDDRVSFSANTDYDKSNWISTGYVTLPMGFGTTYTIHLDGVYEDLNYYSRDNVKSVKIQYTFDQVYTGLIDEDTQWLSNNSNWNSTKNQLTISKDDLEAEAQIWWNVKGQSGGAPTAGYPGFLRLNSIVLVVEYTDTVVLYEDVSSFSEIPETDGQYTLVDFEKNTNGTFKAFFHAIDGKVYRVKSMVLPEAAGDVTRAIYYTEDGNHLLWFMLSNSTDLSSSSIIYNDWLVWSLDTGDFKITKNYTVHGKAYGAGDGFTTYNLLYVDVIFPFEIDDLLSITFNYDYRYHYFVGKPGTWQTVNNQTLFKGETTTTSAPWWNVTTALYTQLLQSSDNFVSRAWEFNQINDITEKVDNKYKSDYVNWMKENGTGTYSVNSIFMPNFKAYKVFLGQFDKFGSNGIEAKDIVLVNFRAEIEGFQLPITVFPGIDQVDIPDTGLPNVPNISGPDFSVLAAFFSEAAKWLLSNPAVLVIFMLIAAKWIYPLFMDAYEGIDKVQKIGRKLLTAKGMLIGLLIFIAVYYFMR